jgi:hypothetical protein
MHASTGSHTPNFTQKVATKLSSMQAGSTINDELYISVKYEYLVTSG